MFVKKRFSLLMQGPFEAKPWILSPHVLSLKAWPLSFQRTPLLHLLQLVL